MTEFEAHELVCPHVYRRDGESAMRFIDPRIRDWLAWFRKHIGKPVYINNYHWGGDKSQRGYRCNLCSLVAEKTEQKILYASAHTRFQAVDFNVKDLSSDDVRQWISRHQDEMPVNIRIENNTQGWVHVDVCNDTPYKIIYFNP